MNQWTPDQRRQQISEMLRNKGIICKDYLVAGKCPRSPTCPYMHIRNGETRPVPWSVCNFFNQGICLRDRCTFFHGTQQQLDELRASGAEVYQPQLYMRIAEPPREFLNPDGSIAVDRAPSLLLAGQAAPRPPQPQPQPQQQPQPLQLYQQLPQVMVLPPNSLVNAPQLQPMQYHYIQPQSPSQVAAASQLANHITAGSPTAALQGYGMPITPIANSHSASSSLMSQVPTQLQPLQPQQSYFSQQNGQPFFFQIPQQ